jgi:hypothetical protein
MLSVRHHDRRRRRIRLIVSHDILALAGASRTRRPLFVAEEHRRALRFPARRRLPERR